MMQKMPFQDGLDVAALSRVEAETPPGTGTRTAIAPQWRVGLPDLTHRLVTLRELRRADATSLFAMLTTDEVRRFLSPPPSDIAGFERFIDWAKAERAAGRYACFAVVPAGYDVAVGILQLRQLEPTFQTAEWGAALGSQFWGTGVFQAAAEMMIEFAFDQVGVHRLEARAAVQNGRANGAARKLGAVLEGVLRRAFLCRGQYLDELLWSILVEDWRQTRVETRPMIH